VTPKLSCASCQPWLTSGQYIARSATIDRFDATRVDTGVFASLASTVSTFTVCRLFAGMARVFETVSPLGSRNVKVTVASESLGFISRMKVSKNGPVAPSARNQLRLAAFTPADSWPPSQSRPLACGKYIARSAMIGCEAMTCMPKD
jgi:hypothetical protein